MEQNTEQKNDQQNPNSVTYPDFPSIVTGVDTPEEKIERVETSMVTAKTPGNGEQEKQNSGQIKLTHPIVYKGMHIDTLNFLPERLTSAAVTKAERIFYIKMPDFPDGRTILFTTSFWAILGGVVCGIDDAAVDMLHAEDMFVLGNRAQQFFFGK